MVEHELRTEVRNNLLRALQSEMEGLNLPIPNLGELDAIIASIVVALDYYPDSIERVRNVTYERVKEVSSESARINALLDEYLERPQ